MKTTTGVGRVDENRPWQVEGERELKLTGSVIAARRRSRKVSASGTKLQDASDGKCGVDGRPILSKRSGES